jgi:hypothetical protein
VKVTRISQIWELDAPVDGNTHVHLVTPTHFEADVPDGTVLMSITGKYAIKGDDYIDQDTRAGWMAYGIPCSGDYSDHLAAGTVDITVGETAEASDDERAAVAIEKLNELAALRGGDPESIHGMADKILLEYVAEDVRAAYQAVVDSCSWWATA